MPPASSTLQIFTGGKPSKQEEKQETEGKTMGGKPSKQETVGTVKIGVGKNRRLWERQKVGKTEMSLERRKGARMTSSRLHWILGRRRVGAVASTEF